MVIKTNQGNIFGAVQAHVVQRCQCHQAETSDATEDSRRTIVAHHEPLQILLHMLKSADDPGLRQWDVMVVKGLSEAI
jgi:hypothetical protein